MSSNESSGHVGPIMFGNEIARQQLVEEGEVITYRATKRTTGDTWWRKTRTGKREGYVTVELLEECRKGALEWLPDSVIEKSGFDSPAAWVEAIKEHNGHVPEKGYLFRVTERDPDD